MPFRRIFHSAGTVPRPELLLSLLLICILSLTAGSARAASSPEVNLTPEETAWLRDNPDLLHIWYDNFPPMEFQGADGSFQGLGADVMRLIGEKLGVKFTMEPAPDWPSQLRELESGEVPIIPVISISSEREKYAFFSRPYTTVPVVIITTKTRSEATSLEDFLGGRVAVVEGYVSEKDLRLAYSGSFEIVPVGSILEGLRDVSFGVVDAFIANVAVAAYYIEKDNLPNLRVAGTTDTTYELTFAVSRKHPLLFSAMQKAFNSIPAEELQRIQEKWITLEKPGVISEEDWETVKGALLFMGALLIGLAGIAWLLKTRLRGREERLEAARAELAEKNERLTLAMQATRAAIWDIYPQSGQVQFSREWFTMLGYEPGEIEETFEGWISLIHPEDVAPTEEILTEFIRSGGKGIYEAEFRMREKDGSWKWVLGKGQAVEWDSSQAPTRIIGMHVDISRTKADQEALAKSEALSTAVFDQAFNYFALLDTEGRIIRLNKTALRKFRASKDHLDGIQFWEGPWWPDPHEAEAFCRRAIDAALKGEILREDIRHRDNLGNDLIVDFSLSPFRDENGELAYLIAEGRDVTEMHSARISIMESEERFRTIFNSAPYSITISRASDGTLLDVNSAFLEQWGESRQTILRLDTKVLTGLSDEEAARIRDKIYEQGIYSQETETLGPDGETRYILYSAVPLRFGGEDAILAIVVDITDRKLTELALNASEKKYRDIFNNAPIGIFRTTFEGRFVEANPALAEMLGYESTVDLMSSCPDIGTDIYPRRSDRAKTLEALQASADGVSREIELIRKDGSPLYAILRAILQKDDSGEFNFIDGTVEDITQRRLADEAIRASEKKFADLFQLSPDALALLSLEDEGRIIDVNESFIQLFGHDKESAVGKNGLELGLFSDSFVHGEILATGKSDRILINRELEIHRRDGTFVVCSLSCRTMTLQGKLHLLQVFRDVSSTKQMQQMMVQTEKMISIGGIAAGIAHEINNPLGIIMQAAQNLIRRVRPDLKKNREAAENTGMDLEILAAYMEERRLNEFLDDIQAAAARASQIIRHMLDFSRRSESRRKSCDVSVILKDALALAGSDFDLRKSYDFKKIRIEIEADGEVPHVSCTETEIEQVLLNILRNAAQAMAVADPPPTEPRIDIRISSDNQWLRLEVADNGPGMPEHVQRRVFEPFFTTKDPGVGTGLGLSVSYFIITNGHHGRFNVVSRPGEGTTFIIELPLDHTTEAVHRKLSPQQPDE